MSGNLRIATPVEVEGFLADIRNPSRKYFRIMDEIEEFCKLVSISKMLNLDARKLHVRIADRAIEIRNQIQMDIARGAITGQITNICGVIALRLLDLQKEYIR